MQGALRDACYANLLVDAPRGRWVVPIEEENILSRVIDRRTRRIIEARTVASSTLPPDAVIRSAVEVFLHLPCSFNADTRLDTLQRLQAFAAQIETIEQGIQSSTSHLFTQISLFLPARRRLGDGFAAVWRDRKGIRSLAPIGLQASIATPRTSCPTFDGI